MHISPVLARAIGTEYVTLNIHTNGTQMEEFNQRSGSEANTVLRFVVAANDSCWFLYVVGLFQNVTVIMFVDIVRCVAWVVITTRYSTGQCLLTCRYTSEAVALPQMMLRRRWRDLFLGFPKIREVRL